MVGEWDGDTAEPSFTAQLEADFRLVRRCALPNWSDTAHELTVWERRPEPDQAAAESGHSPTTESVSAADTDGNSGDASGMPLVSCSACGVAHGCEGAAAGGKGGKQLRRCRLCREVAYCSPECRRKHAKRHAELHALRLLFLERKMSFSNPQDFSDLKL